MLDQIIKRAYYLNRHLEAPFLKERQDYLTYYANKGLCRGSLKSIADYLLRIIQFLRLKKSGLIQMKTIKSAALEWGGYYFYYLMKKAFSETGRRRFTEISVDWLKHMNRLAPLPEEAIPLLNRLFGRRHALCRHTSAPLLKERLLYLQYLEDLKAADSAICVASQYLLIIMEYLQFNIIRMISRKEIQDAAVKWAVNEKVQRRKSKFSSFANGRFVHHALNWFEMLECLKKEPKQVIPFQEYHDKYLAYITHEQGLAESTVISRSSTLKDILTNISSEVQSFEAISAGIIDKVLTKKHNRDGYSRRSVQGYATVIRTFLRYAESQQWCHRGLADSVRAPRVYTQETLPLAPKRDDVKTLLTNCKTGHPTDIRDYAILMLLTVYGMRRSEVTGLKLEDIDWKKEQLYLRRAKGSKPQIFPLSTTVGEAIIRYLKEVRPKHCRLREVFIVRRSPYQALKAGAVYAIVNRRLKPLNLPIRHHGPHALRHACATHLINEGFSLKQISDHLGHRGVETTRIYTKVDLTNLRKVADQKWGGLL